MLQSSTPLVSWYEANVETDLERLKLLSLAGDLWLRILSLSSSVLSPAESSTEPGLPSALPLQNREIVINTSVLY